MTTPANSAFSGGRDPAGRFKPGMSGNPSGRPRGAVRIAELARLRTEAAIEVLTKIMMDADAPPACRIKAAEVLLNRAWGAPTQAHEIAGEPVTITLTYADVGL